MADIGTAYVRIAPNMTGIQSKIAAGFKGSAGPATAALGDEVDKNSGPFQSAIGKLGGIAKVGGLAIASGLAAGVAGIAAITGKAVMAQAELEQQIGGSEAVFGEYAKTIQEKGAAAFKTAGLSQQEFLQGANKMGSLFQGAGFSVQASMQMSADSMQRASDIASIMGISTTEALEAVTGMAKGNFTMMDNLGVAMNDTSLNAYALEKGLGKTTQQMSIQEKVGLAQQLFMEKTAKYAGNYAKENETLSGSLNTTKKAFDNLLSGSGDVNDFIDSIIKTIEIAVPKIVEMLPKIVTGIGKVLGALVPELAKVLPTLVPALIQAVVGLLNALVAALPTIVQVLVNALPILIQAFVQLFLAILQALPQIIKIIADAIPTIVGSIVTALTSPESLQALIIGTIQLMMAIIKALPTIIIALVNALPTIIENIVKTLTSTQFINMMINASMQLFLAIVKAVPGVLGSIIGAVGRILGVIGDTLSPGNLARIGGDLIRGLWNGISNVTGWILDKIKGFGKSVMDGIKGIFGIHSPSTEWAWVGKMDVMGLAKGITDNAGLVDKAVSSLAANAMDGLGMNASLTASAMSTPLADGPASDVASGAGVVQNNNIYNQVDLNSVTRELAWQIR